MSKQKLKSMSGKVKVKNVRAKTYQDLVNKLEEQKAIALVFNKQCCLLQEKLAQADDYLQDIHRYATRRSKKDLKDHLEIIEGLSSIALHHIRNYNADT